ncbi:hypothetical protein [Paracoccus versutus]|uniref:hypothetical protein n=1 Tax=Paracoccus versutus TaxID=34007 RepID=UPI001AD8061E|nr:hypothetical protein [Paracoccus versutus]
MNQGAISAFTAATPIATQPAPLASAAANSCQGSGRARMQALGILAADRDMHGRRPLCRPCLDWSERRPHLAGALGAAICTHALDQGWVRRRIGTRALEITPAGRIGFRQAFGVADAAG